MRSESLLDEYSGIEDLQFKVRDAIEHDLNGLDLGKVVIRSGKADQARKVLPSTMSMSVFGEGAWRIAVHNHSTGPITELQVRVVAIDATGAEVPNAVQRSKDIFSTQDASARLVGDAFSGSLTPVMGSAMARYAGRAITPTVQPKMQGILAAHMADGYPSGLAPDQQAFALHILSAGTSPQVRVEFRDEEGLRWTRTDDRKPQRQESTERRRCRHRETSHAVEEGQADLGAGQAPGLALLRAEQADRVGRRGPQPHRTGC